MDRMAVKETGRDGPVHRMECMELFVDPESSSYSRRYYHFIVAPVANAVFDLRHNFRTARDQDRTWNAKGFEYGFRVDKANGFWTLEMKVPFKDLNAPMPVPGEAWMGNHARERYAGGKELYQWSRGGAGGFCDPRSFAQFRFE